MLKKSAASPRVGIRKALNALALTGLPKTLSPLNFPKPVKPSRDPARLGVQTASAEPCPVRRAACGARNFGCRAYRVQGSGFRASAERVGGCRGLKARNGRQKSSQSMRTPGLKLGSFVFGKGPFFRNPVGVV